MMAPEMAPADGTAADFRGATGARGLAIAVDRLRVMGSRVPSARTSVWNRMPSRARSLNSAAALDGHHRADQPWSPPESPPPSDTDVAHDARLDRSSTRARSLEMVGFNLEADHRVSRDDELLEGRRRRLCGVAAVSTSLLTWRMWSSMSRGIGESEEP